MKRFKFTIIGLMLTVGMFLSCAEAADEDFGTTMMIKVCGIAMIGFVPALAKWLKLFNSEG